MFFVHYITARPEIYSINKAQTTQQRKLLGINMAYQALLVIFCYARDISFKIARTSDLNLFWCLRMTL
jgi:hypothetical protein